MAAFLDGANVVSLALMAVVTWQLGQYAIDRLVPALIAPAALVLLFKTQINPAWLVISGGVVGLVSNSLFG